MARALRGHRLLGEKQTTGWVPLLESVSCILQRRAGASLQSWKLQGGREKTNENANPQVQRVESQTLPGIAYTARNLQETGPWKAQVSAALKEEKEGSMQRPPIRARTL